MCSPGAAPAQLIATPVKRATTASIVTAAEVAASAVVDVHLRGAADQRVCRGGSISFWPSADYTLGAGRPTLRTGESRKTDLKKTIQQNDPMNRQLYVFLSIITASCSFTARVVADT